MFTFVDRNTQLPFSILTKKENPISNNLIPGFYPELTDRENRIAKTEKLDESKGFAMRKRQ